MMPGRKHYAHGAGTDPETGQVPAFPALAECPGFKRHTAQPLHKSLPSFRSVRVAFIHPHLPDILWKGIGESVSRQVCDWTVFKRLSPVQRHYRSADPYCAALCKDKCEGPSLRTTNPERPIEPVPLGVTQFLMDENGIVADSLELNVTGWKPVVDFYPSRMRGETDDK